MISLLSTLAWASVTVTLDRPEAILGDHVGVEVVSDDAGAGTPRPPGVPWATLQPTEQGTSIVVVNGRRQRSTTWRYVLVPSSAGTFELGPFVVPTANGDQVSAPVSLVVRQAPRALPTDGEVFLEAALSDDTPYVGQQVVLTLRLYRRTRLADARLELPEIPGTTFFDLGEQTEYESTVGDRTWQVTEIRKGFVVQRPGTFELAPTRVEAAFYGEQRRRSGRPLFDDVFGRSEVVRRTLSSAPSTISVAPLPPGPPDASGLVGTFALDGALSRDRVEVGGSVTWTLTVSGPANPAVIPAPTMAESSAFRGYDETPTDMIDGTSGTGSRSFRKALIALVPGVHEIPAARLTVFDPSKEAWVTVEAGPWRIEVTGEGAVAAVGSPSGARQPVTREGDDAAAPRWDAAALGSSGPSGWTAAAVLVGLGAAPWLAPWAVSRLQGRSNDDSKRRRAAAAAFTRAVRAASAEPDPRARADAAAEALRRMVRDLTGRGAASATAEETRFILVSSGVSPELSDAVSAVLTKAEASRYGGAPPLDPAEIESVGLRLVRGTAP